MQNVATFAFKEFGSSGNFVCDQSLPPCMPASKRQFHTEALFSDIRELRDVPRDKFLQFVRTLHDNPTLLDNPASARRFKQDLFHRLDSVLVSDTFALQNGGGTFTLESCDPGELVQLTCLCAPKLAQLYWSANAEKSCSRDRPWRAIIGFDEFLPGNPTGGQHSKKTMCVYFNFVELGHATLVESATWMCPLIIPTEIETSVEGEWSRILADFLQRFFFGPTGFLTAGVAITYNDQSFVLFATLGIIMSDGDGLRKAFNWRGAGSMRPCFRHDNILRKNSGLLEQLPGFYEVSHPVPADFNLRTADDLFDSADKVEAAHRRFQTGNLGVTLFENICKSESLNYHALALPWRLNLRSTIDWYGCFTYDWAHSMLQDGPLNVEVFQYLKVCKNFVYFAEVRDWLLLLWIFPAAYRNKGYLLWKIFSEWRQNKDGEHDKLHCSASELLGAYALVRLLLEMRVPDAPERRAAKESFLLCCKLVDIIQAAKKRTMSMLEAADLLEATLIEYLAKHTEAYGDAHIRPKFHWLFDIVEQFRRDEMVHDQFIIERLHLRIKPPAEKVDNLRRWERSVLAEALNHQAQDLKLLQGPCHILDNQVMHSPQFPDATFCKNIRVMGMHLSVRDVVFWQDRVGEIVLCGHEQPDGFFVFLELWDEIEVMTDHASTWRATSRRRAMVDALEVEMVCAWRQLDGDKYVVVRH